MQLILLDRAIEGEDDRDPFENFEQTISGAHIVTWRRHGNDQVTKIILAELLPQGECELKVAIHDSSLVMKDAADAKDKILKNLRDRFYDKVKISIFLGNPGDKYKFKAEGMNISCRNGEYFCSGEIGENSDSDPCKYNGNENYDYEAPTKIIADISLSDDNILATGQGQGQLPFGKKVLEDGYFTDVTITTKEGKKVEAHKCFLATASSVLRTAFSSGFEESKSGSGKLDMSDLSEKGVRAFLRFVYYQDLEEPKKDLQIAYEMLYAGHKYDMFPMEQWAIGHLVEKAVEEFSVELKLTFTIYSFVKNVEAANAKELKIKTARILLSNVKGLEVLPQFKGLVKENPDLVKKIHEEIVKDAAGAGDEEDEASAKRKLSEFQSEEEEYEDDDEDDN